MGNFIILISLFICNIPVNDFDFKQTI